MSAHPTTSWRNIAHSIARTTPRPRKAVTGIIAFLAGAAWAFALVVLWAQSNGVGQ